MASKFLKRNDVAYIDQPNPRYMYSVKIIENSDLNILQAEVNEFLFRLPDVTQTQSPHLVDTQLLEYGQGSANMFVMKMTIYISGTVLTPPIQ